MRTGYAQLVSFFETVIARLNQNPKDESELCNIAVLIDVVCKKNAYVNRKGEQRKEQSRRGLHFARDAAVAWHKSEEGLAWHREQYQRTKDAFHAKNYTKSCALCGKEYRTGRKTKSMFCSKNCKATHRRKSGLMTWSEIVSGVGKSLLSTDTSKRFSAQNNAQARFVKIVEVKSVEGLHPVFCPTVNNGHFVLDNGLIVSNSDALGYMLITHEEHYGEHKVILMREKDILAEVERRGQEGRPQTADSRMEAFIGQKLLAPKSTIFHHG